MQNNNFKYKPTTAFWKIQKLIRDGLPKFKDNQQKVFIIQGGQGAGKTIALLMQIIDAIERTKQEITICSAELSKVKDTVLNDFLKILIDYNLFEQKRYNKAETSYNYDKGHFLEFIGLDKADVGKGRRRNIVYINEANKITLQQFTDISARAEIVIMDYNPDGIFWGNDLITDFNFINLTYLDNEYLSQNEVRNILAYKEKGYNDDGTIKNEYWANKWRVYGLGEVGSVEGRIYYWNKINYRDYLNIDKPIYYAVDWGAVDPFAVVELKYHDGNLYVHELNYASENEIRSKLNPTQLHQINAAENDGLITWLFTNWNIRKDRPVVCDNNRPNKIYTLRGAGWEYAQAVGGKSTLLDRITMLQNLNVYYTDTSSNIAFEQMNYCYSKDKHGNVLENPTDANNHTIDAIVYGLQKLVSDGVVKNL
jgi:phage terminase large subunit